AGPGEIEKRPVSRQGRTGRTPPSPSMMVYLIGDEYQIASGRPSMGTLVGTTLGALVVAVIQSFSAGVVAVRSSNTDVKLDVGPDEALPGEFVLSVSYPGPDRQSRGS